MKISTKNTFSLLLLFGGFTAALSRADSARIKTGLKAPFSHAKIHHKKTISKDFQPWSHDDDDHILDGCQIAWDGICYENDIIGWAESNYDADYFHQPCNVDADCAMQPFFFCDHAVDATTISTCQYRVETWEETYGIMSIFNQAQALGYFVTVLPGCNDPVAVNFDPAATEDDGSCDYVGCMNPLADNYDAQATIDSDCIITGCMNQQAVNFNAEANNSDDSVCIIMGCVDMHAVNYDAAATDDDGSCDYLGCTNPLADNYDAQATIDQGCIITGCMLTHATNYNANANTPNDALCIIPGCTHHSAANYNADATEDDGSCQHYGCTNPIAENYQALFNVDDGSCIISGCTNDAAINYNSEANNEDGSCIIMGCTDDDADNYNEEATDDNGTCEYHGCMDPYADNYAPYFNVDDGSCIVPESGCMYPDALNYNPRVQMDDGSCQFHCAEVVASVCFTTDIGASSTSYTEVELPQTNMACSNQRINTDSPNAADTFDLMINGTTLGVQRSDADAGWGMNLQFDCCTGVMGCTDVNAMNYNQEANIDDGFCEYLGCTYEEAANYDPQATLNDGSCEFPEMNIMGAISCGETVTGSTVGAPHFFGGRSGEAIYEFNADGPLALTFDSCGSQYDTWLRVLDANDTEICGCDDCGPCGLQTVLDCSIPSAGAYSLIVEGWANREGEYEVEARCNYLFQPYSEELTADTQQDGNSDGSDKSLNHFQRKTAVKPTEYHKKATHTKRKGDKCEGDKCEGDKKAFVSKKVAKMLKKALY